MITTEILIQFLNRNPALTVAGIEKEAGMTLRSLSQIINLKRDLTDKQRTKLLPILMKYGYSEAYNLKATTIAVANNKGGVGKTTTTAYLGEAFANRGLKVLLIDLDSQGNLSQIFNVTTEGGQVLDSLLDFNKSLHIVQITENLHLAPSDLELQRAEIALLSAPANQNRLQRALMPFLGTYDFILIDCPPSLSVLTLNALNAANSCIVAMQPEMNAVNGLNSLFKVIVETQVLSNPNLRVEGILFTIVEKNTVHAQLKEAVRENYNSVHVFTTEIKKGIEIKKAQAIKSPIYDFDKNSAAAKSYENLALEILNNMNNKR
jgi:chromosome partitioning protein